VAVIGNVFAAQSALLPAREQMALTLGSHIILASIGMSLPAMILYLHRRGLSGDDTALELAKRWSKVAGVLFAIGAVSGTVLSFELGLLWPGLMGQYGDVIGLAFALEGISFFAEAIFLGIYVYGWDRIPGPVHSLMLIPMIVSGVVGSFFVVSVNGWMNSPAGFDLVNGQVANVDPVAAILNGAAVIEFTHMFLAAYMVTGFSVAAIYAVGISKGRRDHHHWLGLIVPLAFAAIPTLAQPVVGHIAGQRVADEQPVKLAAMEGLGTTEAGAPLVLGGVFRDGEIVGGFEVPVEGLASFLAQNDRRAELAGLDSVPPGDRPPVNVVRTAFQIMVALGTSLAALILWAAWRWRRRRHEFWLSRWFVRAIVMSGPAAIVAMETGWITTEVGRQPWIVQGVLLTNEAVTDAGYIWFTFLASAFLYLAMGVSALAVIRSMTRRWASGDHDLISPYGPSAIEEGRPAGTRDGGSEAPIGSSHGSPQ